MDTSKWRHIVLVIGLVLGVFIGNMLLKYVILNNEDEETFGKVEIHYYETVNEIDYLVVVNWMHGQRHAIYIPVDAVVGLVENDARKIIKIMERKNREKQSK